MSSAHLLVCLSGHGFGHIGMTAPILNALAGLRLTIAGRLPRAILDETLQVPFEHEDRLLDPGLRMDSPLTIDLPASLAAYREFHQDWERKVAEEQAWLRQLRPDAILANAPYRIGEAAAREGIPCLGYSCLNWADILDGLLGPEIAPLVEEISACYRRMTVFLQAEPHMPMTGLPNRRAVGPVTRLGRRHDLQERGKLAMIALGGIPFRPPVEKWPVYPGLTWVVPSAWETRCPHAVSLEALGLSYIDAVASCDLMLTKTGYGSFVEAACHGLPLLSVRRVWPEEPAMRKFMQARGSYREIAPERLQLGDFHAELQELLEGERPQPIPPSGTDQVVAILRHSLP